ncbi:hypothetical protein Tco_0493315 [Tanacetum coccineum]
MMAMVALLTALKIGKCNLQLKFGMSHQRKQPSSVYDVLKLTRFLQAFQVIADAPEIYMQRILASAYVHNRSVRFKMNNKKYIIGLDQFRDILQICPRVDIRRSLTLMSIQLHQPWRSCVCQSSNKCLSGIPSYDSLRLSQAQILWGMYNKKNVDYAYLLWEDFIFKIENKNMKKGNAMYYPRFTKLVVNFVMEKDPSIPRRNKVNWHYARDDPILKEHGVYPGCSRCTNYDSEDDISWKSSDDDQAQDDAQKCQIKMTFIDYSGVKETDDDDSRISSIRCTKMEDNELGRMNVEEQSRIKRLHMKGSGNEAVKEPIPILMEEIKFNLDGQHRARSLSSWIRLPAESKPRNKGVDDIFRQNTEATSLIDTNVTAIMEPSFTAQINRPPTPHPIIIQPQQLPILTPATTTSSSLQNLPNFASLFGFDHRLKALEDNFSELRQTNQYAEALSSIPSTVEQYLANKMQEAVDVAVQLKYDRIREESTTANQQFLDSIDDGMKKIIKEQVKKEVSKIIPKVEKLVTDQLESEVLVRSSKEANTSHAVAANLSELELKKILIDKMEANNSINRSDIQRQLYKALVEAYEADKILLDTYGDTVTIKRPRDGADDDQEPFARTDRGSKRRRSGKEPDSTSAPSETTTKTAGKTTSTGSKTHTKSASQSAPVGEAMHSTDVFKGPADQEFETGVQDEQAEEEVQHLPDWFQKPTRLPSPDHAWNMHEYVCSCRS